MSTTVRKAIILRGAPASGRAQFVDCFRATSGNRHDTSTSMRTGARMSGDIRSRIFGMPTSSSPPSPSCWWNWAGANRPVFPSRRNRGAHEWVDVLNKVKRQIFPFLLTAEWKDILKRLTARHGHHFHPITLDQIGRASFYEHEHYLFSYPEIPGFKEMVINTTGRTEESVADEIVKVAGV